MDIKHMVLKGTAIREHLNRAEEKFDALFVKPVREWLFKQPGCASDVLGVARPCLQVSNDKTSLDGARMMDDLRDLVKAGAISDDELRVMVQDGTFELGIPEKVEKLVSLKMKKPTGAYSIFTPGKPGFAVRWNGIKGSKDTIAAGYTGLGGAELLVEQCASEELCPEVVARIVKGAL